MRGCAYGRGSAFANKASSVETRPVHVNMGVCVHDMVHAWSTDGARGHKAVHIDTWWCMREHDGGMRAQDVHVDIVDADTRRCMRIQSGACRRCGGCANKAVYVDESVHAVDAVGVGAERRMWRWKCILTRPMVQTMRCFQRRGGE